MLGQGRALVVALVVVVAIRPASSYAYTVSGSAWPATLPPSGRRKNMSRPNSAAHNIYHQAAASASSSGRVGRRARHWQATMRLAHSKSAPNHTGWLMWRNHESFDRQAPPHVTRVGRRPNQAFGDTQATELPCSRAVFHRLKHFSSQQLEAPLRPLRLPCRCAASHNYALQSASSPLRPSASLSCPLFASVCLSASQLGQPDRLPRRAGRLDCSSLARPFNVILAAALTSKCLFMQNLRQLQLVLRRRSRNRSLGGQTLLAGRPASRKAEN